MAVISPSYAIPQPFVKISDTSSGLVGCRFAQFRNRSRKPALLVEVTLKLFQQSVWTSAWLSLDIWRSRRFRGDLRGDQRLGDPRLRFGEPFNESLGGIGEGLGSGGRPRLRLGEHRFGDHLRGDLSRPERQCRGE